MSYGVAAVESSIKNENYTAAGAARSQIDFCKYYFLS